MRRRALVGGMAGLLLAGMARAAASPPRWRSLAKALLPRHHRSMAFPLADDASQPSAIRLKVSGGRLFLRAVMLRYGDGHRETLGIDATLQREEGTAAFELAPGRRLAAVRVDFGRFAGNRYLQLMGTDEPAPRAAGSVPPTGHFGFARTQRK